MNLGRPSLSLAAERRAQVRSDVRLSPPRQPVVLTRRERKVKEILLKELARKDSSSLLGGGLSYAEKKRLEQTLDVAFIDGELAKMRKQLRQMPKTMAVGAGIMLLCAAIGIGFGIGEGAFGWWEGLLWLAPLLSNFFTWPAMQRALRRRVFIYEALRELSDADEPDVRLSRAVYEADDLIRRIVERELGVELRHTTPLQD